MSTTATSSANLGAEDSAGRKSYRKYATGMFGGILLSAGFILLLSTDFSSWGWTGTGSSGSITPAVNEYFTAPPAGQPPMKINLAGVLWCLDEDLDDDGVWETRHRNVEDGIEINSTSGKPAEFALIRSSSRAALNDAGCFPSK